LADAAVEWGAQQCELDGQATAVSLTELLVFVKSETVDSWPFVASSSDWHGVESPGSGVASSSYSVGSVLDGSVGSMLHNVDSVLGSILHRSSFMAQHAAGHLPLIVTTTQIRICREDVLNAHHKTRPTLNDPERLQMNMHSSRSTETVTRRFHHYTLRLMAAVGKYELL